MGQVEFLSENESIALIELIASKLTPREIVDFFDQFEYTQPYVDEVIKHPEEVGTCLASLFQEVPKQEILHVLKRLKPSVFSTK